MGKLLNYCFLRDPHLHEGENYPYLIIRDQIFANLEYELKIIKNDYYRICRC